MENHSSSPCVSVIIPVGTPGRYLAPCIASLRAQTLRNIELLFIDDGGADGSMRLVRRAAREDPRIRTVCPHPGRSLSGPGNCRNAGIEKARGRYLAFVDADDYIPPDFLKRLYDKAEKSRAMIAVGIFFHVGAGANKARCAVPSVLPALLPRSLYLSFLHLATRIFPSVPLYAVFRDGHYRALYRKDWILRRKIRYGTTLCGEDSTFLLRACFDDPRTAFTPGAVYFHRCHPLSLSAALCDERIGESEKSLKEQLAFLAGQPQEKISRYYVRKRIRYCRRLRARRKRSRQGAESV